MQNISSNNNRQSSCVRLYISYVPLLTQYCAGGKIETNEMGRACGAYGEGKRCAQGVGGEA